MPSKEIKPLMTLDEVVRMKEYNTYQGDTVLNLQHRIINSSSFNDVESVTHEEILECQRGFLYDILRWKLIRDGNDVNLVHDTVDSIESEVDIIEQWHIENNSILDEVFNLGDEN